MNYRKIRLTLTLDVNRTLRNRQLICCGVLTITVIMTNSANPICISDVKCSHIPKKPSQTVFSSQQKLHFKNIMCVNSLEYMSQQSTFLYSPRTRIRSSRPDAWSVQDVIQAGRSVRPPSPGKASAPLCMRMDTSSYAGACVVRPSEKAL